MKDETLVCRKLIDTLSMICVSEQLSHHFVRIESNLTQQGIPDINGCINGREFWIEVKVDENELSPMQISWHRQREQAGGLVFVITKYDSTWYCGMYKSIQVRDICVAIIRLTITVRRKS